MEISLSSRASSISIHAPREGGDDGETATPHRIFISIHAPREGGDAVIPLQADAPLRISIHAPREGGDVAALSGSRSGK